MTTSDAGERAPETLEEFRNWLKMQKDQLAPRRDEPIGHSGLAYMPIASSNPPGDETYSKVRLHKASLGYRCQQKFLELFDKLVPLELQLKLRKELSLGRAYKVRDLVFQMRLVGERIGTGTRRDAELRTHGGKSDGGIAADDEMLHALRRRVPANVFAASASAAKELDDRRREEKVRAPAGDNSNVADESGARTIVSDRNSTHRAEILDAARRMVARAADRADSKTDKLKKPPKAVPENVKVAKLAKKIKREIKSGATQIDIARDFTDETPENDPKAQSLLRQLRRFPHLLD